VIIALAAGAWAYESRHHTASNDPAVIATPAPAAGVPAPAPETTTGQSLPK